MVVERKVELLLTLEKIVKQSLGVSGVISRITLLVIIINLVIQKIQNSNTNLTGCELSWIEC